MDPERINELLFAGFVSAAWVAALNFVPPSWAPALEIPASVLLIPGLIGSGWFLIGIHEYSPILLGLYLFINWLFWAWVVVMMINRKNARSARARIDGDQPLS